LLARFVADRPELADLRRFVADGFLDAGYPVARVDRAVRRHGLRAAAIDDRGLRGWWARWSQTVHTRLLHRAFLRRGPDRPLQWIRFSITRDELLARHLPHTAGAVPLDEPERVPAGG